MFRSLRAIFLLALVGLAIGPIVLIGLVANGVSFVTIDNLEKKNLQIIAGQVVSRVEFFFDGPVREMRLAVKATGLTALPEDRQRITLLSLILENDAYQSLTLYNYTTRSTVNVSRTGLGSAEAILKNVEVADRDRAGRNAVPTFSALHFDQDLREPIINMQLPVIEMRTGKASHALFAQLRFRVIWDYLSGLNLKDRREAYVADSSGLILAHANPSIVLGKRKIDPDRIGWASSISGVKAMVAAQKFRIGETNMVVFVEQPEEQFKKSNNLVFYMIVTVSIIASALALILFLYFTRKIVVPVEKLAASAEKIGHGNYDNQVDVSGFGEIGILTKAFRTMVSRLEAVHQDLAVKNELLAEEYRKLEQADTSLRNQERFLDSIIENLPNMVFVKEPEELRFVRFNRAGEELTGLSRDDMLGKNDFDLFPEDQAKFFVEKDRDVINSGQDLDIPEEPILTRNKGQRILHTKKVAIHDDIGHPMYLLGISEDITERKQAQERLEFLATHDQLTGLASRVVCMDHIDGAMAISRRHGTKTAILFVDLDGFKVVNDTLGHDAGDELLVKVGERLLDGVREVDTVGRIGGDEFLIVLTNMSHPKDIGTIAEKLVESLSQPFALQRDNVTIGCSIGISLYPDHADEAENLIQKADAAMYQVKREGKNGFAFWSALHDE